MIPVTYELSGKPLFIYEFATENDRMIGISEFAEKTAEMELVAFSKFEKRNILIFYVHEQGVNSDSVPFEKELQGALDSITEG